MNQALDQLVRRLSLAFSVDEILIVRPGVTRQTATKARKVGMWLVRTKWSPQPSLWEVAEMFGAKSHKATMQAVDWVERQITQDTEVGRIANELAHPASTPPPRLRVA